MILAMMAVAGFAIAKDNCGMPTGDCVCGNCGSEEIESIFIDCMNEATSNGENLDNAQAECAQKAMSASAS